MSNGMKVAFACAFGALVGSIVGLQFGAWLGLHNILACIIGFVTGGALGWLTYDIKEVVLAFGRAYRSLRGWRPDWELWRLSAILTVLNACWITTGVTAFTGLFYLGTLSEGRPIPLGTLLGFFAVSLILAPSMFTFFVLGGVGWNGRIEFVRDQLMVVKKFAFHANPVGAGFWVIWGAFYAACWLLIVVLPAVIRMIPFLGRVCWRAYSYTHSEIRATCFIDGGIGAMAGVWFGNPIIGMLVGFGFGLVNYYMISKLLGIQRASS